jgi:hypothetical protein
MPAKTMSPNVAQAVGLLDESDAVSFYGVVADALCQAPVGWITAMTRLPSYSQQSLGSCLHRR